MSKSEGSYRTIGEAAKELGLVNPKTGQLQTHTLRYWETQFKQIKPIVGAGRRRYYSEKSFEILKTIKYLLKKKGLTLNGAKKLLNNKRIDSLDQIEDLGLYSSGLKTPKNIKDRLKKISKLINEIKNLK